MEGLYREDLVEHEPDLWERYREHPHYRRLDHVDGVLLSHGHVDHSGALGFLKPEIPVYTGLMTAVIGKGIQDCRPLGLEGELVYLAPKEHDGDGVLRSVRGAARIGRPHVICEHWLGIEGAMAELQPFWGDVPGPRTELDQKPLALQDLTDIGIEFHRVDHSIPGSGAFALDTEAGWVVYTGDLRRHGHSKWRTEEFAQAVARLQPAVLVVEGTQLAEPAIEEPEVHEAALDAVKAEPGMVIADFGPRNIERLRTFHDIAKELGRRLVVTAKDAYLLERMHVVDPNIPTPDSAVLAVLKEPVSQRNHWEREMLNRYAANVVLASDVRRSPGDYILCLSFFDIKNLVDLEPRGGTYIYSSSEAWNEEQAIDHRRLKEWLDHFGLKAVGGLPGAETGPFHASGHIDGPGMEWLIETIAPERIVPVHSQQLGWFEERWGERVVRAGYGERVEIG